jgi:hypothetical protein
MTAAVVSLIATVIGFLVWLIKRKAANAELPGTILKKYEDEARKIIAARDVAGVNALLDDRLRAIDRHSSGQGSGLSKVEPAQPEGGIPRPGS